MGGSAAEHNNFWQLFVRPAATGKWRLATPPGVASNGGLVLASPGAGSVVAGFRPSQDLSYSPLATTHDNGTAWTPGLLDAALADVPDALAAAPGGGHLLALLASGKAELSGPGGTGWTTLATRQTLAASAAGPPLRAGQPHRRGVQPHPGFPCWPPAAPTPGPPASSPTPAARGTRPGPRCRPRTRTRHVTVLRLTTTASTTTALLAAGTGSAAQPAAPPGPPTAAPTGPCRRRCRCTARSSPRPRPGPAAPWRSC